MYPVFNHQYDVTLLTQYGQYGYKYIFIDIGMIILITLFSIQNSLSCFDNNNIFSSNLNLKLYLDYVTMQIIYHKEFNVLSGVLYHIVIFL